jgi:hypothetical protein
MSIITTTGPIHSDPLEPLLQRLAKQVDAVAKQIAVESYERERYEEPTTSRLAEAISAAVRSDPIEVSGLTVEVQVEEFTRSEESVNGADLYVSLVRNDLIIAPVSKVC